jgi:hypothetical protein
LAGRFSAIAALPYEEGDYCKVLKNETEGLVDELGEIADLVIDTDTSTVEDAVTQVITSIGL